MPDMRDYVRRDDHVDWSVLEAAREWRKKAPLYAITERGPASVAFAFEYKIRELAYLGVLKPSEVLPTEEVLRLAYETTPQAIRTGLVTLQNEYVLNFSQEAKIGNLYKVSIDLPVLDKRRSLTPGISPIAYDVSKLWHTSAPDEEKLRSYTSSLGMDSETAQNILDQLRHVHEIKSHLGSADYRRGKSIIDARSSAILGMAETYKTLAARVSQFPATKREAAHLRVATFLGMATAEGATRPGDEYPSATQIATLVGATTNSVVEAMHMLTLHGFATGVDGHYRVSNNVHGLPTPVLLQRIETMRQTKPRGMPA